MPQEGFGLRRIAEPSIGTALVGYFNLRQLGCSLQGNHGLESVVVDFDVTEKLICFGKAIGYDQIGGNVALRVRGLCLECMAIEVVLRRNHPLQHQPLIPVGDERQLIGFIDGQELGLLLCICRERILRQCT